MARTNKLELKNQWAISLAEGNIKNMDDAKTTAILNYDWGLAYKLQSKIDGAKDILHYFKSNVDIKEEKP